MRILLFTGAGASAELGVPTMRPMVEQFRHHLVEQRLREDILSKIDEDLQSANYDMENLIEKLDSISNGLAAGRGWGAVSENPLIEQIRIARAEAEWFVLHLCEQVRSRWAGLLWQPVLRSVGGHVLTLATTNYDRAIEIGASQLGVQLDDGFHVFGDGEYVEWAGFGPEPALKLLKVHGSTDWYHGSGGSVWKLRHPMPLFGTLKLSLGGDSPPTLTGAAVLPSREKRITQTPYPALVYELRKAALEADLALFVGTSLRDPDIRSLCDDCATKGPTLVVSRGAQLEDGVVPRAARIVRQSASRFLISTLPAALREASPATKLEQPTRGAASAADGVLDRLVVALDDTILPIQRCVAIEELAAASVGLQQQDIEPLIRDSSDQVRTYALALVQDSPDREPLLALSRQLAATNADSPFGREVALLEKLLGS